MSKEFEAAISGLHARLTSTKYTFEFDTEDIALGFRKTNKTSTRSLGKALAMERKLRHDLGRFISPTVRITAVRMYRNGEKRADLTA